MDLDSQGSFHSISPPLCSAKKWANFIADKLQEVFGVIDYLKIFHTDNGKEFTAKVLLKKNCDLNTNIFTVTGRPCHPSDQGSVENMNKFAKRTLDTVLAKYRLAGKHYNLTEVLGSIALAINTQHGWGKDDVSAYEAVYGQNLFKGGNVPVLDSSRPA